MRNLLVPRDILVILPICLMILLIFIDANDFSINLSTRWGKHLSNKMAKLRYSLFWANGATAQTEQPPDEIVENDGVTVVTAFVDFGDHEKGPGGRRHVSEYLRWISAWKQIMNPVMFYTDSQKFKDNMDSKRLKFQDITRTVMFNRSDYWAFSLVPQIAKIFAQKGYPRHPPNTVVKEYPAVMSAKYEFLEKSIRRNFFRTKYYMWLDLGLFRGYPKTAPCFNLAPPPKFDDYTVAVNQVSKIETGLSAENIIRHNRVSVGGGVIFGTRDVLLQYIKQYKNTVEELLKRKLMSTDQQVVYSAYSDASLGIVNKVPLTTYEQIGRTKYNSDPWFHLAYLMRNETKCPRKD